MTESSDSDFIQRKKSKINKSSYYSEDSSSSLLTEESNMIEDNFEPLFYEIFGNGNEYDYIYKTKQNQSQSVKHTDNVELIPSECYAYINKLIKGFSVLFREFDQPVVRNLIDGYTPEYLAFHTDKMTIKELHFIKDMIEEFREFLQFTDKKEKVDSLLSAKISRISDNSIKIPGMIDISEFTQNMLSFESLFYPSGSISLPFDIGSVKENKPAEEDGWGVEEPVNNDKTGLSDADKDLLVKYFHKLIHDISSNSVFIDRVHKTHLIKILEPDHCHNSIYSLSFLQKIFCSGCCDMDDEIRKFIIEKAFESVDVDIESIKRKLIKQGMIDGPSGLQELVNLIISLRGKPGSYAGVYFDKSLFSVVKIDDTGDFTESAIFKETEINELKNFLLCVENVCLTSTSPYVKYVFMNAGINFLYVPRRLSFFDDFKELSIPYNITLLVQNPVIYFSRLWYFMKNGYPISNYRSSDATMLENAIAISAATIRLDWKDTLRHKFGFTIFKLLKIDIFELAFDFEKLDKLESLKQIFDQVKFNNICTYFNLSSSKNPLERTLIHPTNFSMAKIFFKGQYHSLLNSRNDVIMNYPNLDLEKDENKIVEIFVEKPSLLEYFSEFRSNDNDLMFFNVLKSVMLRPDEIYFSGANDMQIFDDVVPNLSEDKVHSATIIKAGPNFYLCQASNSATIYISKRSEYEVNQIVKVKIIDKTPFALTYTGEIVEEQQASLEKFRTHRYFKNLDYKSLEIFMSKNDKKIQIRPTSTQDCCVVVCKIEDDLFFSYKLKEVCENEKVLYEFKNRVFPSIDLFIDDYLKKMYKTVQSIVSFKYYFESIEKAKTHLETPGEFIKYCVVLSREMPGYLEFILGGKRIFAKIDGDRLILKDYTFKSFDDFVGFVKIHIKTL